MFYNSWEDLKHNLILDWVDVRDGSGRCGLALFSDHPTSYTHGPDLPRDAEVLRVGQGPG